MLCVNILCRVFGVIQDHLAQLTQDIMFTQRIVSFAVRYSNSILSGGESRSAGVSMADKSFREYDGESKLTAPSFLADFSDLFGYLFHTDYQICLYSQRPALLFLR